MQLFIDSADPSAIKQAVAWGYVDGVTTNPSLAAKVGKPYHEIVQDILQIVDGPVSLEVIATDYQEIMRQAQALAKLGGQVVVKIPCIQAGLKAAKELHQQGIDTNITLVFNEAQALLAAKVGAKYCSPFIGRIDDISDHGGDRLVERIRKLYDAYGFRTQILAASIRDLAHVEEMAVLGADIATVPFEILQELPNHPLTTVGLEKFLDDWKAAGLELPL